MNALPCRGAVSPQTRLSKIGGEGVGQGVKLRKLSFGQGGFERDLAVEDLDVLQAAEDLAHRLAARGRPAAVFDQGDLAVLQVVGGDVVQEVFHRHKDAVVVGRGGKDQAAAAEGVGEDVAGRDDGGVVHAHLHAALGQLDGEDVGRVLGMAVDGGIGDQHALLLRGIARPELVFFDEPVEVLPPDKAVQRADQGDIERGGLFQRRLDLRAVLADDIGIVAARLVQMLAEEIGLVSKEAAVERAEGTESVGREEDLIGAVVAHHDLGPVHHRRHDEAELVAAGLQAVPFLDQNNALRQIEGEKLRQHGLDFRVADDLRLGIAGHQQLERGGVVGLHVVDDQIVERTSAQRIGDVFQKYAVHGLVHRVKQHGFLIQQQIGVVGHALGHAVHALKAGKPAVVGADPDQILADFSCAVHKCSS